MYKKQLSLVNVSLSEVHNGPVRGSLQSQVTIAGLGNDVLHLLRDRVLIFSIQILIGNFCDRVNPHLRKQSKKKIKK